LRRKINGKFGSCYITDCVKKMCKMEDNSIDLILTDPPYNVDAKAYSHSKTKADEKVAYDDKMEKEAYLRWSFDWFTEAERIAKMVVFSPGHLNIDMWHTIKKPDDYLIHYKPDGQGFSANAMTTKGEIYLVYGKLKRRFSSNVVVANIEHHRRYGIHPHPKPPLLYKKIIEQLQPETVFDPFLGGGTTAVVCEELGVSWSGCELNERYAVEDIERRIGEVVYTSDEGILEI